MIVTHAAYALPMIILPTRRAFSLPSILGSTAGLCSNALAYVMDAFALAFAFDSSAFAIALAFDSNAFDLIKCETNANQMTLYYCCCSIMFIFLVGFVWNKRYSE